MKNNQIDEENWEGEAPLLASLDRKEEGEVPEGYFESLPQFLMDRIRSEEIGAGQETPVHRPFVPKEDEENGKIRSFRPLMWIAVAASAAILVVAGIWWPKNDSGSTGYDLVAEVGSLEDAELFTALEQSDVHEEEILALMGDKSLEHFGSPQIPDDEAILDFLNNSDLNDLELENLQ